MNKMNKMKNEEVLIYESVLNYQMNRTDQDKINEVKLLDLKHYKLQYCLDTNLERIQKEAEKIRNIISKMQSDRHKELLDIFRKEYFDKITENPDLTEQLFLDGWKYSEEWKKEVDLFLPKRADILMQDSDIELYKVNKDILDNDLPINRQLFAILKPFLLD